MLEIRAAAFASFFALQASTTTSSTYQPSIPVHPSMPKSKRSRIVSPRLTPSRDRSMNDWPHEPVTCPPSVPVKRRLASGFVLPAAASRASRCRGLK